MFEIGRAHRESPPLRAQSHHASIHVPWLPRTPPANSVHSPVPADEYAIPGSPSASPSESEFRSPQAKNLSRESLHGSVRTPPLRFRPLAPSGPAAFRIHLRYG